MGDRGAGNPAFLGACEVYIWPGLILHLPSAVCFGSCFRIVQSPVADDPDRRAVIWRDVSKIDLVERVDIRFRDLYGKRQFSV